MLLDYKDFLKIAKIVADEGSFLALVHFPSHQQRLRPLGYCAPAPKLSLDVFGFSGQKLSLWNLMLRFAQFLNP